VAGGPGRPVCTIIEHIPAKPVGIPRNLRAHPGFDTVAVAADIFRHVPGAAEYIH
jgi:hypothetical protein